MNIVYLIGNGFDINLGLKTRYLDFFEYYKSTPSKNDLIRQLKQSMAEDIENWSDMELALGRYTLNLKNAEEFNIVFDDLEDSLADYLEEVEKKLDIKTIDRTKFYEHLVFPEDFLTLADRNKVHAFKQNWKGYVWNISIITFNYTRSLEKILENESERLILSLREHDTYVNPVEHIHGFTDDRMVLGVNDISQIGNEEFRDNPDIIESLIKTSCNQAQKHLIDNSCKDILSKANLICIFGSSIGQTDRFWWELIGKRLIKDIKVVIFVKDGTIVKRRNQRIGMIERKVKSQFYERAGIQSDKTHLVENNLFIGIDTEFFNIRVKSD